MEIPEIYAIIDQLSTAPHPSESAQTRRAEQRGVLVLDNLQTLTSQPDSFRDEVWEKDFLQAFVSGKVKVTDTHPVVGPDGWPYLFVETGSEEIGEPVSRVIAWLSEKGIGLVVNANKALPDYIFSYGMIWNFRERAEFNSHLPDVHPGEVTINVRSGIKISEPSPQYLPSYVRQVLREFLQQQEINEPRVLAIQQTSGHTDLCFSTESLGSPSADDCNTLAEALSWFLPNHYSILLASEKELGTFFSL